MLPLREVANRQPGVGIIWVHVPFSMSDLALCKEKLREFSEDRSKFTKGFHHVTLPYELTWTDPPLPARGRPAPGPVPVR